MTRTFILSILLVLVLLTIIPVITMYFLTQTYDYQVRTETSRLSASIAQTIKSFMEGAYNLSYELAVNPIILTMNPELVVPILVNSAERNNFFELLYIQGTDGMQIARSSGPLGYRGNRHWFLQVMENKQPHVYRSYVSLATGTPCTSVFIPMFRDNELAGIFGADISLFYFQQLALEFADEENGRFSFLIDGEGTVVAHPDVTLLQTLTNFKTQVRTVPTLNDEGLPLVNPDGSVVSHEEKYEISEGFQNVIASVMAGSRGLEIIEEGGRTYYASFEPIEMPGFSDSWSLLTLQDREIAHNAIAVLLRRVFVLVSIIFIVFIIIATRFFRSLNNTLNYLEHARNDAVNANKSKSAFLSTMSHEIRTPLNAILGITGIQLQKEKQDSSLKESFEKIYVSGNMLLGIINDILDLSKIEAGKLEIINDKYETASLLSDTAQLNMMRIGNKPVDFELYADENLPVFLTGDELRVKQILNNLLSNSIKYSDKGKVKLSVSVNNNVNFPDAGFDEQITIRFIVSDMGQGMTEEQIARLFDEYSRFNMRANRTTEGTGLGMSITRNLVRLMGGDISVESEPGKGTVFTADIPQGKAAEEVLGKKLAENLSKFRTGTHVNLKRIKVETVPMPYGNVLIVDDAEINIFVAKGMLTPYQLNIDSADSGFQAIEKIKEGKVYDIIFMDHMMPKMDGIEAVKIIRETGYKEPIIALTANAVVGQADIFLENGFDGFISKPIDMREMNDILIRFVRDKHESEDTTQETQKQTHAKVPEADYSALLNDAKKTLSKLEEIISKNGELSESDIRSYTIHVHGMKSSLAIIGKMDLSYAAQNLETAGRNMDIETIKAQTPAFAKLLKAMIDELALI